MLVAELMVIDDTVNVVPPDDVSTADGEPADRKAVPVIARLVAPAATTVDAVLVTVGTARTVATDTAAPLLIVYTVTTASTVRPTKFVDNAGTVAVI